MTLNDFIKSKIWRQILSLILAICLWFFVVVVINPDATVNVINIPVNPINHAQIKDRGLIISNEGDLRITASVHGSRSLISQVDNQNIIAMVSLLGVESPGEYTLPVEIILPFDSLSLANRGTKQVKVTITEELEIE